MKTLKISLLFLCLCSLSAQAADQILWNHYFTITIEPGIRYGTYEEKVVLRNKRINFQVNSWKQEEGVINEDQLGVFTENNDSMKPLFFNYRSLSKGVETRVDGTIMEGNFLIANIKKNGQDVNSIKKNLAPKAFFSSVFPLWLKKNWDSMKPGQPVGYQVILEDNLDLAYSPVSGVVTIEQPDEFAKKTKTLKLSVKLDQTQMIWWVDKEGAVMKIENPAARMIVERVTKAVAQSFLKTATPAESVPAQTPPKKSPAQQPLPQKKSGNTGP